jgi:GLPGLI family protein
MKNLILIILLFLGTKTLFAQQEGVITYKVLSGIGWNYTNKLYFSHDQALYVKEDAEDKILVNEPNRRSTVTHEYIRYYMDANQKIGIKQKKKGNNQLVRTEFPLVLPSWKIMSETKIINGYTCTKAVAVLAELGNAEAWFASKIPVRVGPPKIWGLPGLILEIKCSNGLEFQLEKLELKPIKPEEVQLTDGKLVPAKDYGNSKSKVQAWAEKTNKAMDEGDK